MTILMLAAGASLFALMPAEQGAVFQEKQPTLLEERAALKVPERDDWQTNRVHVFAFSPDGTKLVVASSMYRNNPALEEAWRKIPIWNMADKTITRELTGHNDYVRHVAFSRDGKEVVGAARKCVTIRRTDTEIVAWNAASGVLAWRVEAEGEPKGLSRFGDVLLTADSRAGKVIAYEIAKEGKKIFSIEIKGLRECVLAPDGRLAATVTKDDLVQVWDLAAAKEKMRYSLPEGPSPEIPHMFFSQDGSVFTVRGGVWQRTGRLTRCWSLPENKMVGEFVFSGKEFSPSGKYLLGIRKDDISLVSLKSQKRVAELEFKGEKWRGSSFLFSPDGRSVIVAGDEKIRVWDLPKDLPE